MKSNYLCRQLQLPKKDLKKEGCKPDHNKAVELTWWPYWKTDIMQRRNSRRKITGNHVEFICKLQQILASFIENQRVFLNQKAFVFCRKAQNYNPGGQLLNDF